MPRSPMLMLCSQGSTPEIDDIRNGNVGTGSSVADINSLKASFPEFYQVKFMEDNQGTITVMSTGSSASVRHMNKTQLQMVETTV